MPRKKATEAAVIAAEKKYLDQDGLAHLVQKNDERYVKKEVGKGLSSNDFSDEYKKKIDDLAVHQDCNQQSDCHEQQQRNRCDSYCI
ncbi:MAG: hypothetical protein ACLUJR_01820 [Mediterraneibacter gnavus]